MPSFRFEIIDANSVFDAHCLEFPDINAAEIHARRIVRANSKRPLPLKYVAVFDHLGRALLKVQFDGIARVQP
jgi:hypothetical protein